MQILETRPGITVRFLLAVPREPAAIVVLFAGGAGRLGIDISGRIRQLHNNFLIRSRRLFAAQGLAVATVDVPSDRNGQNGLHDGFRASEEHAADIAAVTAFLRSRLHRPVWLVGTSRGTISAANAAIRNQSGSGGSPDGLVMTASVTEETRRRPLHVMSLRLGSIRRPVLIAHHRRDGCRVSPYEGAERLKAALAGAPAADLIAYTGGDRGDKPCRAKSHHGFLGIERQVVGDIAGWIKARGMR